MAMEGLAAQRINQSPAREFIDHKISKIFLQSEYSTNLRTKAIEKFESFKEPKII
jgi:hypothetical protein